LPLPVPAVADTAEDGRTITAIIMNGLLAEAGDGAATELRSQAS